MNRLQKLLASPQQIVIKDKVEKLYKPTHLTTSIYPEYMSCRSGLLEMMQPLIANMAHLRMMQDPGLSYKEVVKEYLISFIKNAPVAVAMLDLDLRFVSYSSKWAFWFKQNLPFKHEAIQLIGKNMSELLSPCPPLIKKFLKSNLSGVNEVRDNLEYSIKNKAKAIRWESFPWRDHDQRPLGIIVFCEDITKRQKLVLRAKKLEQSNQLLENFALIFSHDLLQPIRQISNFVDILKGEFKNHNINNPQINHTLSAINKSLLQISNLSEGIILYCRKGNLAINSEAVSLLGAINEISNSCLMTNQFNLDIQFSKDIYLKANKTCVLQLFQNLLINAFKYSSGKIPIITINAVKAENGFYKVTIHNEGECSSKYIKKNIFEPFCSSNVDGTGLGMMICKKIVTAYGGNIEIKSSAKHGTTVSLTLPAAN